MVIIMSTKQRLGLNHPKTNPTTVSFFVCFKTLPPTKGLVTLLALERFFTRVYSFMLFHILCAAKRLVTMLALERLLTSVFSFMYSQTFCIAKRPATMFALKRLLTSVYSFMFFSIPAWLKALLHCLHLKGFSPVCFLSCTLRLSA